MIADDQSLRRGALGTLVDTAPDMTAVGEAETGLEAVALARSEQPDVVVMDIRMPELDGIEATRRITTDPATRGVRVLVLTTFGVDEYIYGALRAGASGFLLKDAPPSELLAAIRVVAVGDALLAPGVTRRLIAEFARQPQPSVLRNPMLDGVTQREAEVLVLVARGPSNIEIAAELRIGLNTTKTRVSRLLMKLQARDRAQLVIAAYETGLVAARNSF